VTRLSLATLPHLKGRTDVRLPAYDPAAVAVRIVHLGVGAFFRAHQAPFIEDADHGWGIHGFTQRSATVRDQLAPQDGLYTLVERGPGAAVPRVVGVVRDVGVLADRPAQRMADPEVRIVTLTVSEKGYRFGPDGHLNLADDGIRHDLSTVDEPRTVIGQLVAALASRKERHGVGLSLLCCDNLTANGKALRRLVFDFVRDDDLAAWIDEHVSFPSSMVDRIVPATRPGDLAAVGSLLGVEDLGVVVAEPFRQWVIEDAFTAGRPAWTDGGAVLTGDVTPYEHAKLRLLNGTHSLLAYAGFLAGHATIHEAAADPRLAAAAEALMVEDASPTLDLPPDFDLPAYRRSILDRFANASLAYRTTQVALDGSMKLPIRLLATVRDRLAAGASPTWAAFAVAAWMTYVVRASAAGTLDDPLAAELGAAVAGKSSPGAVVDALLGVRQVFGDDLRDSVTFRALLVSHAEELLRD
jgi:fructuronate reductase